MVMRRGGAEKASGLTGVPRPRHCVGRHSASFSRNDEALAQESLSPRVTDMLFSIQYLLAETRLSDLSLEYQEKIESQSISGVWFLMIPLLVVGIAMICFKIADRAPMAVNTPNLMMHELCRAHRLSAGGRRMLERIADEAQLEQPATMFLGPQHFEAAVEKAGLTIKYDKRHQTLIAMLRRTLFTQQPKTIA